MATSAYAEVRQPTGNVDAWYVNASPPGVGWTDPPEGVGTSNPTPPYGTHWTLEPNTAGTHQHYFVGGSPSVTHAVGRKLIVYVYPSVAAPPGGIQVQVHASANWTDRWHWGANTYVPSILVSADVPASGVWHTLVIDLDESIAAGEPITGLAFTIHGGGEAHFAAGVFADGVAAAPLDPVAVATATPNPVPDETTAISLDGTGSFDPDGTIASYFWELVSGPGTGTFADATDPTTTFTPVVPWSPVDLAGLALWVKADSLALSDGDPVSTWADESGNADNLTASGADRPTYETNALNGLPVVRFSTHQLEVVPAGFAPGQPLTVMVVFKATDLSGARVLFDSQATNPCDVYFSGGTVTQEAGSTQTSAAVLSAATTYTLIAVFNGTSSKMYLNGTLITSGNVGTNGLNGLRLGKNRSGGAPFNGDIGEVVVAGAVLDVDDINALGSYSERWGHSWTDVPPFSPLDLSPVVWVDASDPTTITDAGAGAVSQLNDKSGNGNHFTQGTAGNRPVTGATVNSLNAIDFDGINDYLVGPLFSTVVDNFSMYVVISIDGASEAMCPFYLGAGASNGYGPTPHGYNSTAAGFLRGGIAWHAGASGTYKMSGIHVLSLVRTAGLWAMRLDGVHIWSVSGNGPNAPATRSSIGVHDVGFGSGNGVLNGKFCEAAFYASPHGTTDRETVEAHLMSKWGVV